MTKFKQTTFETKIANGEFEVEYGPTRCGIYQVRSCATRKVRTVCVEG